jgi:hypothetical protein
MAVGKGLTAGITAFSAASRRRCRRRTCRRFVAYYCSAAYKDVINGNTPKALIGLLAGENRGKRMIKV